MPTGAHVLDAAQGVPRLDSAHRDANRSGEKQSWPTTHDGDTYQSTLAAGDDMEDHGEKSSTYTDDTLSPDFVSDYIMDYDLDLPHVELQASAGEPAHEQVEHEVEMGAIGESASSAESM
jgi:hypothetical protein